MHSTLQAPVPQSKVEDYDPYSQKGLFDNYDIQKQYFLAKGHLTPNADFNTDDERLLTMITTNIAPQWQKFNSENWSGLEKGVRRCASSGKRELYVFTGVGKYSEPSMCQCIRQQFRDLQRKYIF